MINLFRDPVPKVTKLGDNIVQGYGQKIFLESAILDFIYDI